MYSDDRHITFEQRRQELWLFTPLRELPPSVEEKRKHYSALLHACGAGALRYGSTVSVDDPSGNFLVHQRFSLNSLSILDLEQALDRFLQSVDYYNNAL